MVLPGLGGVDCRWYARTRGGVGLADADVREAIPNEEALVQMERPSKRVA